MDEFISWRKHRYIIISALIFLGMLFFASAFLPPEPVWITDNGSKLMIMHNYAANGSLFFEHPSPENFPCGGFHFQPLPDGRITSFHSPYLPVLTAWMGKIAGSTGILLIPMLCGAAIFAVLCRFPGGKVRIIAALAATPVLFYSLLLWEMVPAALAVTLAAWLFFRKRFIFAGAVFALGLWMREELFLLGFILLIILLCRRQWRIILHFGMGAIVPFSALLLTNYLLYGHIAGVHGATYFINNRTGGFSLAVWGNEVLFNFCQHLIRFETLPRYSLYAALLALVPALIAGWAPEYRKWRKFKLISGTVFAVAALVFAGALWCRKDYLYVSAVTFGLFISVPPLLGFLLNYRALLRDKHPVTAIGAWLCTGYILAVPLLLNPNDIGLTWGARHFIMILPLLLLLGAYGWHKSGLFAGIYGKTVFTACCAAGIVMQIYALKALVKVTGDAEFLQQEILSLPHETVVSDLFFLPEMTPLVPFTKTQLEISDEKQLRAALKYLHEKRIREFILILSPDYRRIDNRCLAVLLSRYRVRMKPITYRIGNSLTFYLVICSAP